jgi:hypothetical protein
LETIIAGVFASRGRAFATRLAFTFPIDPPLNLGTLAFLFPC